MSFLPPLFQIALGLVVTLALVFDVKEKRIPNWVALLGLSLGFGLNAIAWGWGGVATAAKGCGLGFGVYLGLYLLRAMGAGDVKLMAAVGSIAGATNWLGIFVCTALVGGVFGLAAVITKGRFVKTFWNIRFIVEELSRGRAPYKNMPELDVANPQALRLPHAVAVAGGAAAFVAASWIWAPR